MHRTTPLTPAEPKTEGTEELKGDGMTSNVTRLVVGVAVVIIKAAHARAKDDSHDNGHHSTGHVDRSRTGQIDGSAAKERIGVGIGQPAVDGPEAVRDDGVDEAGQEGTVEQIGGHLAPLGDGTGNDGGQGAREGELEEPLLHVDAGHQKEVGVADEGGAAVGIVAAVGKGVADGPEGDAAAGGIEEVPKEDVLAVLAADGSGAKHGKSRLHKVDEGAVEQVEELQ